MRGRVTARAQHSAFACTDAGALTDACPCMCTGRFRGTLVQRTLTRPCTSMKKSVALSPSRKITCGARRVSTQGQRTQGGASGERSAHRAAVEGAQRAELSQKLQLRRRTQARAPTHTSHVGAGDSVRADKCMDERVRHAHTRPPSPNAQARARGRTDSSGMADHRRTRYLRIASAARCFITALRAARAADRWQGTRGAGRGSDNNCLLLCPVASAHPVHAAHTHIRTECSRPARPKSQ